MPKTENLILIFCFSMLCLSSKMQAQTDDAYPPVTIQSSSISVKEILEEITSQTGLNFSFNAKAIEVEQVISFSVKKASLQKTLQILCKKTDLEFSLIENQIVLYLPKDTGLKPEKLLTISGFISDQTSGESLIGATIAALGTASGTSTNEFGFYSLDLKPGKYQLQYSYVGYEMTTAELDLSKNAEKDLSLSRTSIDLPDVIVGLQLQNVLDNKQLGQPELLPDDLNNMPEFAGESGLVKGLQTLPGIQTQGDGSAFFYTRGGERDQNLIIIDDAPIYNPSHLFGFFSMVIPDFTKSIKVYKSDVPTNLGDRLSSIVSIRTKDGNLNKFEFHGAINPFINRFSIETPIVKKRGSIFVSFRRTHLEKWYKKSLPNANFSFGDFIFKWNHRINKKNRVYFTTLYGGDNFTNLGSGIRWGNFAATLRWNHIFSPKLFSNTTIYTGNYAYRLSFKPTYWNSGLGTLSLKSDFTHYASPTFKSKFGLELQGYFIDPGSSSLDTAIAILPTIKPNYTRKQVLYYQGEFDFSEKIKFSAGLRIINWANLGPATYHSYDNNYEVVDTIHAGRRVYKNYFNVDPRLSMSYKLDNASRLKLSFGVYHQYLQLISNSVSPFTSMEIWLPAGPNIRPQSSWQLDLSYLKYLEKPKIEMSAAVYFKKFNHQIDYKDHATTYLNPLLEGELRFGTMRSFGLELFLKKDFGRLTGWTGYTFSRAIRNTKDLNDGKNYRAVQDRPHEFSLMLNYKLKRRILGSAYWTMQSGTPFSSPTGFYTFNDRTVPIFSERNNDRLPAYNRLDLAIKFILNKKEKSRYQHSLTFSVYNFLANKNVVNLKFNKIPVEDGRPIIKTNLLSETALSPTQIDLIRFLPSLTYKFKL